MSGGKVVRLSHKNAPHAKESSKNGKFYGAVDPMQIMFDLNEFMKYRSVMLDKIESERRSEERNKMLSNPKCITREQYEAQKKQNAK